MPDLTTLQIRLTEAETALHRLSIGGGIARVSSPDGTMIEYSASSISQLTAYVTKLQSEIAGLQGTANATGRRSAILPVFIFE